MITATPITITVLLLCALLVLVTKGESIDELQETFSNAPAPDWLRGSSAKLREYSSAHHHDEPEQRYKRETSNSEPKEKPKPETCEALQRIQTKVCPTAIEGVENRKKRDIWDWVKDKLEKAKDKVTQVLGGPTAWANSWRQAKLKFQKLFKGVIPNFPEFVEPHEPYSVTKVPKPKVTCSEVSTLHSTLCA